MQSEMLGCVMSAWQLCLDIFKAEGIVRENSVFLNDFWGGDASYLFGLTPPQSAGTLFANWTEN